MLRTGWAVVRYGVEMLRGLRPHLLQAREDVRAVSLARRIFEQERLLLTRGTTAADYYLYELFRPELSWAQKREFVGEFNRFAWQRRFNIPFYRAFTEDKVIFKRCLAQMGLPVPVLLGVVGPQGRAESGLPLRTPDELRAWLEHERIERVVLKPVRGSRGAGVLALGDRMPGRLEWAANPHALTFDDIVTHLIDFRHQPYFLVEERLYPHPGLRDLAPDVLHSARIVTALDRGVEIVAAVLRIGLGDVPADNFSMGNLAAPIDLATGRLGRGVMKQAPRERHRSHPITGAPIEGRLIPDWRQALEAVTRAAQVTPFNPLQGWDVGFSERGPVIVEANSTWDVDLMQLASDRGLLGTSLKAYLAREHERPS